MIWEIQEERRRNVQVQRSYVTEYQLLRSKEEELLPSRSASGLFQRYLVGRCRRQVARLDRPVVRSSRALLRFVISHGLFFKVQSSHGVAFGLGMLNYCLPCGHKTHRYSHLPALPSLSSLPFASSSSSPLALKICGNGWSQNMAETRYPEDMPVYLGLPVKE